MNYAIILAAGKGTRMKVDLPKCAVPLLNKPMISYLIDSLSKTTIDKSICVLGHKKEVFFELLGNQVEYAIQEEQLGTAHAVNCVRNIIGNDKGYSIIIPGDTPLIDEIILQGLIDTHLNQHNDLTIGTIFLENPFGYGRILRKDNHIQRIVEEKDASLEEKQIKEINSGLMCVDNQLLFSALSQVKNNNAKGEYYLTDIVEILSSSHKIGSYTIEDAYKLAGINDLYHLSEIERELKLAIHKKHLLNGVIIENPDTVTIGPDVEISSNVTIRPGSILIGKTRIKANAIIGPNSEIKDSLVEEGATVRHSVVYDSIVGKNAQIGPFTHLRMNTVIGDNDRIGNFVEIKNSTLGEKTNVSHLTYVGDTTCGNGVNWGCGTVTVNYDGQNKFKTIVGNNVFIGCNSNLIAPIKIEDNSFIAAGSTITENLEKNDFAIARAKQITKKGYACKYKYKKFDEKK